MSPLLEQTIRPSNEPPETTTAQAHAQSKKRETHLRLSLQRVLAIVRDKCFDGFRLVRRRAPEELLPHTVLR